ncbi:MAG TPA: hypothetical protein VED18_06760 [Candidatus Sulfotelmatobacter sp.]|nr:hypothetical protein [Candidatus Sulfotelmatobacter sp.]
MRTTKKWLCAVVAFAVLGPLAPTTLLAQEGTWTTMPNGSMRYTRNDGPNGPFGPAVRRYPARPRPPEELIIMGPEGKVVQRGNLKVFIPSNGGPEKVYGR